MGKTGPFTGKATHFLKEFSEQIPRGLQSRFKKDHSPPNALWVTPERILQNDTIAYDPRHPADQILVGHFHDKLIGLSDNRHMCTIGGSRSGKSLTLKANLFFYQGSILALDPKGELARDTAHARIAMGQEVHILDPFNRVKDADLQTCRTGCYNPLSILSMDSETIIEDAALISDALVIAEGTDPHWDESARNFIEGIILHCSTSPEIKNRDLVTVYDLLMSALHKDDDDDDDHEDPYEQLERLHSDPEEESEESPYLLLKDMLTNAAFIEDHHGDERLALAIRGAANDFYEKGDKEMASVLSTARRHMKFLASKAMLNVLRGDSLDLRHLKSNPRGVTVYLCLPAGRMGTFNRWMRLFVNMFIESMEREETVPRSPVLLCLDEFPVLGHMKILEDAIGQVASFNVKIWILLQDLNQLKAIYKDRYESFLGNSGIIQVFGLSDLTTAEYFSRLLGKTPIEVKRPDGVSMMQRLQGSTGESANTEMHDLMTADELTRYFARDDALKRQLVLWTGKRPMMIQRVEYFDTTSPVYHHFRNVIKN